MDSVSLHWSISIRSLFYHGFFNSAWRGVIGRIQANVISYQKMSDGNDVARIYVDTMFDVRIQYEFLNSNESLWDKEEQDFIVRVTTEKTADFRVESSIVFNLKIDCNQNVEFLEYIETPTDIDIQTYDMIEVISYKNKYPF